jgi:hypothetical protein
MGWEGTNPADWAEQVKRQMFAVFRGSVQDLAEEMTLSRERGGKTPVVTGNLARSLLAQKGSMPTVSAGTEKFSGQDIGPVLLDLELGDTVYLGFQAAYARRVNNGFVGEDSLGRTYNQSGAGFVEAAAANWPTIVQLHTEDVKRRTGG